MSAAAVISPEEFTYDELDNRCALERVRARRAHLVREIVDLRQDLMAVSLELEALQEQTTGPMSEEYRKGIVALAKKRFNGDPSKGLALLVDKKVIEYTSDAVATFLQDVDMLDKRVLGEYLGEGKPFNIEVLGKFVERQDFSGLTFDRALRKFLALFRLPGEAQKIDRVMERFAMRYHHCNPTIFSSSDTAYVLAFSIIMLNTDLHNPAIKNKISRDAFVRNNRGINNGTDLPVALLQELYDTILKEEIRMEEDLLFQTFYNPEREGYLAKQGGRVKTWKRRWFILTGNCLYYFKTPTDTAPCGIIPLENLDIQDGLADSGTVDRKTKFRFGLVQGSNQAKIKAAKTVDGKMVEGHHREYLFASETDDEREDWIRSMRANMQKTPGYALMQAKKEKVTNRQTGASGELSDED